MLGIRQDWPACQKGAYLRVAGPRAGLKQTANCTSTARHNIIIEQPAGVNNATNMRLTVACHFLELLE